VTRYLARIFLIALLLDTAIPVSGFAQSSDQSWNAIEATPTPRAAIQGREIGPKQGLVFTLGDMVGVAYFTLHAAFLQRTLQAHRRATSAGAFQCSGLGLFRAPSTIWNVQKSHRNCEIYDDPERGSPSFADGA
jgi:hypothetical protein